MACTPHGRVQQWRVLCGVRRGHRKIFSSCGGSEETNAQIHVVNHCALFPCFHIGIMPMSIYHLAHHHHLLLPNSTEDGMAAIPPRLSRLVGIIVCCTVNPVLVISRWKNHMRTHFTSSYTIWRQYCSCQPDTAVATLFWVHMGQERQRLCWDRVSHWWTLSPFLQPHTEETLTTDQKHIFIVSAYSMYFEREIKKRTISPVFSLTNCCNVCEPRKVSLIGRVETDGLENMSTLRCCR